MIKMKLYNGMTFILFLMTRNVAFIALKKCFSNLTRFGRLTILVNMRI